MQSGAQLRPIVVVDDNPDDLFFFRRALAKAKIENPVFVAHDGDEAIDTMQKLAAAIAEGEPVPLIAFLDLKLPRANGFAVLEWIRAQPLFGPMPVAVLSSSAEPRDVARAYELGAAMYLVKQPAADDLLAAISAAVVLAEEGDVTRLKLPGVERPSRP
jgi:CheY-like chemotaxis protein